MSADALEQDAAIAAAAVLNLVDPSMTGIGGDAFCLFYEAKSKKVHALNGSGRSAARASLEDVCRDLGIQDRIYGAIPTDSILSVTVPGAAAAWLDIIEHFGSGKVTASQALAPAIRLAEQGFAVSEISSYCVRYDTSASQAAVPRCPASDLRVRLLVDQGRRGTAEEAQRDRSAQGGPSCTRRLQGSTSRGTNKEPSVGENL